MMQYSYATVEKTLAQALCVDEKTLGALRGRLKNMQRLGLAAYSPGSGKRVQYTLSNIYDWALALSLAEFGLDPKIISKTIRIGFFDSEIYDLHPEFQEEDLYFVFFPSLISSYDKSSDQTPLEYMITPISKLSIDITVNKVLYKRFSAFNITELMFRINNALIPNMLA